ncbi:phthiocerol/phthiodiolone dimycocerosyl transferase family protein [Nocardia transvalensis]|uniref:phthiocerol/phthiodiolone dimycocerosyl transferase family protein n=1 Tax=Nocardia transvalensis TaxID=37333 RepID=UPI00189604CF|nr:hypothetical protein [Nocardia transvalensis]MBF6327701.1 hypothetical protein [Nocardia transvalensis]
MRTVEQRYLSPGESNLLTLGVGPVVAQARIDGAVDPETLRRALDLLAVEYPLLGSRIVEDGDGYLLQSAAGEGPSLTDAAIDDDPFTLELNTPVPREHELARAGVFRDGGDGVVSLAIDHSAADGRLTTTLLRKLLGYYAALAEGQVPNPAPGHGLESPLEARLDARYGTEEDFGAPEQIAPAMLPTPALGRPVPAQRFGVGHLSQGRRATTALTQRARADGLTMNGLLSGIVATALSDVVDGPIAFMFPVDLRSRLRPALRPDAQLLSVGPIHTVVATTEQPDAIDLGRQITTQVRTAIDEALPQKSILAMKARDRSGPETLPSMTISNLGRLDTPPLPPGAGLRAVRFGTTFPQPSPILFASSTDGRLDLDLVYDRTYFTDEQMTGLTAGIQAGLERFASVGV